MRYKVQDLTTGLIATVEAQSHAGAKRLYIARKQPGKGTPLLVWQDEHDASAVGMCSERKNMRV
jgi:hypothetical protein